MTPEETILLLGIKPYYSILPGIARAIDGFIYRFMNPDEYQALIRTNPQAAYRVYWLEILHRAHLAAATALLRQHRWLEGTVTAACLPNFLAFAACLRGFVESSADIWDGLNGVARSLGNYFEKIRSVLAGQFEEVLSGQELEDRLIHFQFARKIRQDEPHLSIHKAKHVRDYLTTLQGSDKGSLHDCYSELCTVTHPVAESLLWFAPESDHAKFTEHVLSKAPDEWAIRAFCDKFTDLPSWMVQQGFNLPLLILKVLNEFGVPEVRTPIIDEINLDDISTWRHIKEQIDK